MLTELAPIADRARKDVVYFARVIVGEPLWDHQSEAALSPARIRVLRAGRQVGKSRLLAVLALWEAFRAPDRHVLLLSAGEDSAKDLLAEVVALSGADLLTGSVEDESLSRVVLSNGSWIRSIPASAKQARGKSIDLLVLDEACFVSEEVWSAAKYTMAARPGSRLLLASSPYGRRDAFFAVHDRMGADGLADVAGVTVESFVWPSTVSPLVRAAGLVEFWRKTDPPRVFAAEVLAEWQEDAGAFFTAAEISDAVCDFSMIDPARAWGQMVAGGVDYGMVHDASTIALVGVAADGDLNLKRHPTEPVFFVAHLEEHFRSTYTKFVKRVVDVADPEVGGFRVRCLASETNGVGAMPTESLFQLAHERRTGMRVAAVHTDSRRKESGFGAIKGLLQDGRLVLPRHPGLLRQLSALEFETSDSGSLRISVPERSGHDDLAMALMQAVSCVRHTLGYRPQWVEQGTGDVVSTPGGTFMFERPRCASVPDAFVVPKGREREDGW